MPSSVRTVTGSRAAQAGVGLAHRDVAGNVDVEQVDLAVAWRAARRADRTPVQVLYDLRRAGHGFEQRAADQVDAQLGAPARRGGRWSARGSAPPRARSSSRAPRQKNTSGSTISAAPRLGRRARQARGGGEVGVLVGARARAERQRRESVGSWRSQSDGEAIASSVRTAPGEAQAKYRQGSRLPRPQGDGPHPASLPACRCANGVVAAWTRQRARRGGSMANEDKSQTPA